MVESGEPIGSDRAVEALARLSRKRELPRRMRVDNSPEFIAKRRQ